MDINFSYDDEFCDLMTNLKTKYGEKLFELDGIGKKQLDINKFSKQFFNNIKATADVSIDSNSNVTQSDIITYNVELPKPFFRLNAYFILWRKLKQLYGKEEADRIIEMQLTGDVYINDFHGLQSPYCFNYSTYDIALLGLPFITKIKSIAPKHLYSFKSLLEQFVVYASNSTLGAVGLADVIITMSYFIDKIIRTGIDAKFELKNERAVWIYVKENIVSLIYTLNQPFRGGVQSAFTNISIFDDNFLNELIPEYKFINENGEQVTPKLETIKKTQEIFLDVMNEELSRTPVTFPITTACISVDENNNTTDQPFIKMIAEKNKQFGFINFYCGKVSTISSCCRLRSDTDNEYFNAFGAGSTKIGSLGVVTTNLPRLAIKSDNKETFLINLKNLVIDVARINNAKRHIIRKRIEVGAAPLYRLGFMSIDKQYSTFGITGLNEAVELLGYDILEPDGQQLVLDMLETINKTNDKLQKQYDAPHNTEQTPAENSGIKLSKKDALLKYTEGSLFYSNQFIPLIKKADMLDRIKLQGLFDSHFSGGSILHINVEEQIENTQKIVDLINTCANKGVVYWAINYNLQMCEADHMSIGANGNCPICGKPIKENFTRVVGFLTNTKHWNITRRTTDYPNRQFYKGI
jgi:ribonucleoside-triphosphate reductase